MPYCTELDLTNSYTTKVIAQLTGDASGAAVDSTKVDAAIEDVDELIDAHAGKQHALPFTIVPKLLKKISVEEVFYEITARRGTNSVPDNLQKKHDGNLKLLEKISKGSVTLGVLNDAGDDRDTYDRPATPLQTNELLFGRGR